METLGQRQLLVVTGKGGVGKSAVAAAIAQSLAESRRVLLLEVDPRENVHQLFSAPPSDGGYVPLGANLHLQNLRPGSVVDQLVAERVRIKPIVRRVLASPIYRHFTAGAPGLEEMAVLGHALRVLEGVAPEAPLADVVVLDAPATGHGVAMLAAPLLVGEVITQGPIGEMSRQVAAMVADPERSGVVVVTLAEEMPVNEALELSETLEDRVGRGADLMVVNRLYPPCPDLAGADDPLRLWRDRRRVNEEEMHRLELRWSGPRIDLPWLPTPKGPQLVEALAGPLAEALAREGSG